MAKRHALTPNRSTVSPRRTKLADRLAPVLAGSTSARPEAGQQVHDASRASSFQPHAWLLLAHILRPQGRKGEVLADLFTDFPDRFAGEPTVFLAKPGFTGAPAEARAAQVLSFFLPVGRNVGRIVLQLAEVDSIAAAETLAGLEIVVPAAERLEPEEDAAYISDLLGCSLFDRASGNSDVASESLVGVIDDIHFPTTADGARRLLEAAPLLSVLSPSGAEILVPYVKAFLLDVDLVGKRIVMSLPEGLLEVNP